MGNAEKKPEACVTMPYYEFDEGLYEIDEFDCVSIFVVKGKESAIVLDTGTGIGDLRWLVENRIISGIPYRVLASHNHGDHIGGCGWFSEVHIHPDDCDWEHLDTGPNMRFRKGYAALIRRREGKNYAYDPQKDIREWPHSPQKTPLADGQRFDLGGRCLTAYHCPGHTPGEMVFLDNKSRTLFVGDACNCNYLLNTQLAPTARQSLEISLRALSRIWEMRACYDRVYNFHHDFRGFGQPLSPQVIPDLIACMNEMLDGSACYEEVPNVLALEGDSLTKTVARHGIACISLAAGSIRDTMDRG